jgi:hypothetical protein
MEFEIERVKFRYGRVTIKPEDWKYLSINDQRSARHCSASSAVDTGNFIACWIPLPSSLGLRLLLPGGPDLIFLVVPLQSPPRW